MAKRRHKIEPISVDEITASPSLEGYDAFLRFRPQGETPTGDSPVSALPISGFPAPDEPPPMGDVLPPMGPDPAGEQPVGPSPVGSSPVGSSTIDEVAISTAPIGEIHVTSVGFGVPGRRQKVRRALSIQDGHSHGEHQLYEALWTRGTFESSDTRLITIGYGGMQELCRLDKTNCKKNILSLIEKLAVEISGPFDIRKNLGNTYRIFSPSAVLRRRQQAGLEFVIRTSGVRFVSRP